MKNKKIYNNAKIAVFTGILGLVTFSCSDLEDVALDKVTNASSVAPSQLLASAYNQLGAFTDQANAYALTTHSTDEMQGPTRGTDWDDNGRWRNLHTHTWTGTADDVVGAWDGLNKGHALANEAINNSGGDVKIQAEGSFLRAFFMFHIMDLFGQVPFKEFANGESTSKVLTRAEAANQIIADLNLAIPNLPNHSGINTGKATKEAAQAFLAKVYLNKAVYNANPTTPEGPYTFDKADMDKVIAACDAVINSGKFKISTEYFKNFAPDNTEASPELIFAILNEKGQSGNSGSSAQNRYFMTTHYNQNPGGWNGFTTLSDFYNSFEKGDSRLGGTVIDSKNSGLRTGFLAGQQFGVGGVELKDRQGGPLAFTSKPFDFKVANEVDGVRVIKYSPDFTDVASPSNDYVFMRYSDILLMKAEALFRSGSAASGLALVNTLRKVRGINDLSTLTNDNLLAERGHELYWEGWRRNDLIRYGKFTATFENKPNVSPGYRVLFPIPQKEIEINPLLKQNTGY